MTRFVELLELHKAKELVEQPEVQTDIESQLLRFHDRDLIFQTDIGNREVTVQSSCIQLNSVSETDKNDGIV